MERKKLPEGFTQTPNKPAFVPTWENSPFQHWAIKFVRKNQWRVTHILPTKEDGLQECGVVFTKCKNAYVGSVDNPKWFMGLFQRSVHNQWALLARRNAKIAQVNQSLDDGLDLENVSANVDSLGQNNLGPISLRLQFASEEFNAVMRGLADAPAEVVNSLLESTSSILCLNTKIRQWFKTSKDFDFANELKSLLTED